MEQNCAMWKEKYPVILPKHFAHTDEEPANVYAFIHAVSSRLREGQVTVVGNGSACVVGGHAYIIKKDQRFITNSAIAPWVMTCRQPSAPGPLPGIRAATARAGTEAETT